MAYTKPPTTAETNRRLAQAQKNRESASPGGRSAVEGQSTVQERYRSWLDKTSAYARTHPEIME
jgi:hypothetical protein